MGGDITRHRAHRKQRQGGCATGVTENMLRSVKQMAHMYDRFYLTEVNAIIEVQWKGE